MIGTDALSLRLGKTLKAFTFPTQVIVQDPGEKQHCETISTSTFRRQGISVLIAATGAENCLSLTIAKAQPLFGNTRSLAVS